MNLYQAFIVIELWDGREDTYYSKNLYDSKEAAKKEFTNLRNEITIEDPDDYEIIDESINTLNYESGV